MMLNKGFAHVILTLAIAALLASSFFVIRSNVLGITTDEFGKEIKQIELGLKATSPEKLEKEIMSLDKYLE